MLDERQRLRVVHDHHVMIEMQARRVFERHLLVDLHLQVGEIDVAALQGVVHFLGDAEEVRAAFDHAPAGPDAGGVHQQRQRGQQLGDAAAVIGRIDVDDVHVVQRLHLLEQPLDRLGADQRLIVLDRGQLEAPRVPADRPVPASIRAPHNPSVPFRFRPHLSLYLLPHYDAHDGNRSR